MLAEITFVPSGSSMVIIDHTYVSDEMREKGTGSKLVASVVDEMRQQGKKIMPLCPFAKAEFERHKEYEDVLHKKD
ncbi:GNAT family N-acetyltransferase [Geomicrobium sp. JCM 19039]|uniref:GNAT family N-acetyltransferase n=1 Tax=Geomicrobium sp. JCM 19039 TaxID=1460636 RepID=UPI0005A635CD|nr:GNAT family N-acetyltransferase [Geomicrobium sp. JCM 19039]